MHGIEEGNGALFRKLALLSSEQLKKIAAKSLTSKDGGLTGAEVSAIEGYLSRVVGLAPEALGLKRGVREIFNKRASELLAELPDEFRSRIVVEFIEEPMFSAIAKYGGIGEFGTEQCSLRTLSQMCQS